MKNTTQSAAFHCTALVLISVCLLFLFAGCAEKPLEYQGQEASDRFFEKHTTEATNADVFKENTEDEEPELPSRFQEPTFLFSQSSSFDDDDFIIPIGADISSSARPVPLREIMKKLAAFKGMNVSWASDVDQGALVDVDIRAEDDFFAAIDNILRQVDYFHEVKNNSIIIKYRDTKTYHIALPYLTTSYSVSIGGNVLGGGDDSSGDLDGSITLESKGRDDSVFDVWLNIEENLATILDLYTETATEKKISLTDSVSEDNDRFSHPSSNDKDSVNRSSAKETETSISRSSNPGALGTVIIDKPLGLITITAPRAILAKTDQYFEILKKELYRQVNIEAKILEVELTGDNRTGINWDSLLNSSFDFQIDFQRFSVEHEVLGQPFNDFLTLKNKSFSLLLDLIETQGHTEILSNPRITVMNGQPALINVGTSEEYVRELIQTASDNGTVTVTPTVEQVFSGVGLGVVPNIIGDEVILNLTPIESKRTDWDEFEFQGSTLKLPVIAVREMNTIVRVKSGDMLIIGGLIASGEDYEESGVAGLRNLPGVAAKAFGTSGTLGLKKELVILLRPVIENL